MEKTISCGRVAHLRLQAVYPVCLKAISRFYQQQLDIKPISIEVIENKACSVHAWLDAELLAETILIFLTDLANCPSIDNKISVKIKQIGSNTCRIIISDDKEIHLNECNGPFEVADCPYFNADLNDARMIITMHGGFTQIWKSKESSKCFFEINLVCMSKSGESDYDSLKD